MMVESGNVRTFGMTALRGLLELLRIAEQDERLAGLRNRQHVGERHLRGLIDEQHIDGLEGAPARAQSHAVPPATWIRTSTDCVSTSSFSVVKSMRGSFLLVSELFWMHVQV